MHIHALVPVEHLLTLVVFLLPLVSLIHPVLHVRLHAEQLLHLASELSSPTRLLQVLGGRPPTATKARTRASARTLPPPAAGSSASPAPPSSSAIFASEATEEP